jgi:hypothetical protein
LDLNTRKHNLIAIKRFSFSKNNPIKTAQALQGMVFSENSSKIDRLIPDACILYYWLTNKVLFSQDFTAHAIIRTCMGDFLG